MEKPTLFYFPVRGRGELIRLILAETQTEYDEHPVMKDSPPRNGRPTDFTALKDSGLLPFQAVPVWEEPDGFRVAQSLAIIRHLSRKHGLMGSTPREEALVDQMLGAYDDVRPEIRKLVIAAPGDRAAVRAELNNAFLPRWLKNFDRLLTSNEGGTGHLVGRSFTVADLALWCLLELVRDNGFGPLIDKHPVLTAYAARVGERPRILAWTKSPRRPVFIPPPV